MSAPLSIWLALSIVVPLAGLAGVACWTVVSAILAGGRREDTEAADAWSVSRFTIPVSVIVPMSADVAAASATIAALTGLEYPEFEIIAVSNGTASLDSLAREWELEPREFFYRRSIDTAAVRRIHRSAREPRLIVVEKAPGTGADALNCGLNIARYRYVMPLPTHVTFDRGALLRLMTAPLQDPATVVGASSHVEALDAFGRLASVRSLMASRLVWRHQPGGFPPAAAVSVWRRDAVLEAGGFSAKGADLDLHLARRVLRTEGPERGTRRFCRGADIFGRAAKPGAARRAGSASRLLSALRLVAEGVTGLGASGPAALALFAGSEILIPLALVWVAGSLVLGAALGAIAVTTAVLGLLLLLFGRAVVSTAALLLRGAAAHAPADVELTRLILLTPVPWEGAGRSGNTGR